MNEEQKSTDTERQADGNSVAELIERAFHYRGDVTIRRDDGSSITGYLFNRNARTNEPFAQVFETQSGREVSTPYRGITQVLFTGRDTAAPPARLSKASRHGQEGPAQAGPHPLRTRAERHED